MNRSKAFASIAMPLVAFSSMLSAAKNSAACEPTLPAACNADTCQKNYCLGPENYGASAPVNPRTCNGDWVVDIAGFYWNSHQEGLEYAIVNDQQEAGWRDSMTYIDSSAQQPKFAWDFGCKVGVGYNTNCDGWGFGLNWTWYQGKANSHIEAEVSDNKIMLAYLSNFGDINHFPLVTDAQAHWKLGLNLVDVELGREFWNSKRLALRPFVGLRYASLKQDYTVHYKGGSLTIPDTGVTPANPIPQNDKIKMDNNFQGVGLRGGINSVWHIGCGWGLYGDLALSVVYGRFDVEVQEELRAARSPYDKTKLTEFNSNFRASRFMSDFALGIQWASLLSDDQYAITIALGWEHHMFLNQNQLYRFNHTLVNFSEEQGQHLASSEIDRMHGDLDTQGWTLSVKFDF